MLKTAKEWILRTARTAGAYSAVGRSSWRTNQLLILCYHGISQEDEHEWNPGLYMDRETFRERLEMLRSGGCRVLPLEEALDLVQSGRLPQRSVAITIDDGSYDFYTLGYPLLKEFGYPATLYLTTYYCRHQLPVFDTTCAYVLWKGRGRSFDATGLIRGVSGELALTHENQWREVFQTLYRQVREEDLSARDKDALTEELARRLGINYDRIRNRRMFHIMGPEEAREVSRSGISIQLHTHRHRTPRDKSLFEREVRDNRREIMEMIAPAREPAHFCYPSGDYVPEFFPWLRDAGVISAATCETGFASATGNPLELPRLVDKQTLPAVEFEGWLTGFRALLPQRGA